MNFSKARRDVEIEVAPHPGRGNRRIMDTPHRDVKAAYHAHGAGLLGYLRRLVGGTEQAEDALHETFVQAMRHPERMAEAASVRAWLFGVARHIGLATRRRRPMVELPEQVEVPPDEASDERVERMRSLIARLPDGPREALELRLKHELSYEEIAVSLDIPIGTVRSRLHTAMRQLREAMIGERL